VKRSAVEPGAGTTIYPGAVTAEPCFELVFRPWLTPGVKSPRVHFLSAGLVAGDWPGWTEGCVVVVGRGAVGEVSE
jgi:hypothetical protein